MNYIDSTQSGLQTLISKLERQKHELYTIYRSAIDKGEKLESVKNIYLTLKDLDNRLRDLLRGNAVAIQ